MAAIPGPAKEPCGQSRTGTWNSITRKASLDEFDLKTTFRYWKGLQQGFASRNAIITSGTMEVSGGSRLNYRSNVGMYTNSIDSGVFNQLTELEIHEG